MANPLPSSPCRKLRWSPRHRRPDSYRTRATGFESATYGAGGAIRLTLNRTAQIGQRCDQSISQADERSLEELTPLLPFRVLEDRLPRFHEEPMEVTADANV